MAQRKNGDAGEVDAESRNGGIAGEGRRYRLRLAKQLAVQKHVHAVKAAGDISEKRRLLREFAFYPGHDRRKESSAYHKVHRDMTVTKNLPCMVCGVSFQTLADPKQNPYGADQMETHHHIVEWALANAVDVGRFNKILRPNLAFRHPEKPEYKTDMNAQQVRDWVDHSPDNLWVLCNVHHRAKYFGIHEITYPIWCPMDLLIPDFENYVKHALEKAAAEEKAQKAATSKKVAPRNA
jgi:hypothetical protein